MMNLFPPIRTYTKHWLDVEPPHQLLVEESGNPQGFPVLFVHGGPGAGCSADDRRFFDPEYYRIILVDQRGCGKSTPHASLEGNTTQAIVQDIEAVRKFLGIQRWMLFGGSFGSTLSLLYAQKYPQAVSGMVLRGIFLGRQKDLDWFYKEGANRLFPDYWEEFVKFIPEEERDDLIKAYHKRLFGNDDLVRMSAAKAWSEWEGRCSSLHSSQGILSRFTNPHTALSMSRIECDFFLNKCYIDENQILNNMEVIENIPSIIVHGRYDAICPLDNALLLNAAWPSSDLYIVRDAGHTAYEEGTMKALIQATETMKQFNNA